MQSKGPSIPVRLNRRVLLKPMSLMSGDNLVDIRKATRDNRAEFRNSVKVYNGATVAIMNRELGIQYRDLSFKVTTFRRKQQTMYKTMCQLVALKRRVTREALEREQKVANAMDIVARRCSLPAAQARALPPVATIGSALDEMARANCPTPPAPPVARAPLRPRSVSNGRARVDVAESPSGGPVTGSSTVLRPNDEASSRATGRSGDAASAVAADKRDDALQAIVATGEPKTLSRVFAADRASVAERTLRLLADGMRGVKETPRDPPPSPAQVVVATNSKRAFFTATISKFPLLPPIGEAQRLGSAEDARDFGGDGDLGQDDVAAGSGAAAVLNRTPLDERCWRRKRPTPAAVATEALRPASATRLSEAAAAGRSRADADAAAVAQSADGSIGGSKRDGIPLAAELRRARKLKDAQRKRLLDSELCPVYRQTASGDFRTERPSYEREEFPEPTHSAEYRRLKLLEAVKGAISEHMVKANAFLASISQQEERENIPPPIKLAPSPVPKTKFRSSAVGKAAAAPPAPQDSGTNELDSCTYVRRYVRPSERDSSLPPVTSWNQRE